MRELIFATGNRHKVQEVAAMLDDRYRILSLPDIGCREEIPETSNTIEGNALQKARYVRDRYQVDCFAEDTGLEIDALDGAPGVFSARYAGPDRDSEANMALVLQQLEGQAQRTARFRTVVALVLQGREYTFEGVVEGHIAQVKQGSGGFGYDPLFIPLGYDRSFAEMTAEEKNAISHRGRAIRKLTDFLREKEGALP